MTPRTVLWGALRRGEIGVAAREGALPLLPIGATEQHGPHLPVNTDINAALTVCVRAAESLNGHAGQAEISIALYLQADHVDPGSLESDPGVDLPSARRAFAAGHGVYEPPWPEQDSPQAVFGHPPGATAHKGQNIIEAAATGLADLVREFRATLPREAFDQT